MELGLGSGLANPNPNPDPNLTLTLTLTLALTQTQTQTLTRTRTLPLTLPLTLAKVVVMECLLEVPVSNLQAEEVQNIVQIIANCDNLTVGSTEVIIGHAFQVPPREI